MKISFDFDSTLEHRDVQKIAKDLIDAGHDVCILTTRFSDTSKYNFPVTHDDLFEVAKKLNIKEINFTEYEWKYKHIDNLEIDVHIDDNYDDEVRMINGTCKAKAVLYDRFYEWEDHLYKAIKEVEDARRT